VNNRTLPEQSSNWKPSASTTEIKCTPSMASISSQRFRSESRLWDRPAPASLRCYIWLAAEMLGVAFDLDTASGFTPYLKGPSVAAEAPLCTYIPEGPKGRNCRMRSRHNCT
jgi:hypothetical protein